MSRSYKKVFGFKDGSIHNSHKKFANRKVRHYKHGLNNGGSYKKLYEQWDICDWKCLYFSKQSILKLLQFDEEYDYQQYNRSGFDFWIRKWKNNKKNAAQLFHRYIRK